MGCGCVCKKLFEEQKQIKGLSILCQILNRLNGGVMNKGLGGRLKMVVGQNKSK